MYPKKIQTGLENNHQILAEVFAQNYISIVKLQLQTGKAIVLKSDLDPEMIGRWVTWEELLKRYVQRRTFPTDREIVLSLTLERMREFHEEGDGSFSTEVRCNSGEKSYQWVEISAFPVNSEEDTLIFTTKNIGDSRVMRRIVELFVLRNYDYLVLIDSKNNSYIRFAGNAGRVPVPPETGSDYTADMIHFNRMYVAAEDYERVTANMQLDHVMKMLESSDSYSFTSGGITIEGKYRRSRLIFLYYDKAAGLILGARTDVTQIYMEEQEKNSRLVAALREAQHDALTKLYNQKATAELISRSLESQYRSMAAILFIDIDNFKMVNDTYGHQKGDVLLRFLADYIKGIAGREGIAGRLGGDEFLLYLPTVPATEKVKLAAQKICEAFDGWEDAEMDKKQLSCSVGISVYPHDGTDYETLLRKADQALYTSKRYGKNQYYFYSCKIEEDFPMMDQERERLFRKCT